MLVLSTPRLTIRPFLEGDAPAMAEVFGDAEVMRFSLSGSLNDAAVADWVREQAGVYALSPGFGRWAICEREGERAIGYVKLMQEEGLTAEREAELGFRLARRSWGRGYATEAVQAIVEHAFGTGKIDRLIGIVDPHNGASVRVLQKLGMSYARPISFPGYDHPDHLYVLDRPGL